MKKIAAIVGAIALSAAIPAFAQQAAPRPSPAPQAVPVGLIAFQIGVSDLQKSADFYSALGLKVTLKPHPNEWRLGWAAPTQSGSIMLLLYDPAKPSKVAPGTGFMIVGVPDAAAVVAKLRAMGRTDVPDARDAGTYVVAILTDPDGNRIEMIGQKK